MEFESPLEDVESLNRDIFVAIRDRSMQIGRRDIRFFVDLFYQIQEFRKSAANEKRSAEMLNSEPSALVTWINRRFSRLEREIKKVMDAWTDQDEVSAWAKQITGIGPVISAGLAAYVDLERTTSVSRLWRFAGLDPSLTWFGKAGADQLVAAVMNTEKKVTEEVVHAVAARANWKPENVIRQLDRPDRNGKVHKWTREGLCKVMARKPWSAGLKLLCWKIGDCFMKCSGDGKERRWSFFNDVYRRERMRQIAINASGGNVDTCRRELRSRRFRSGETKDAYEAGRLPDGRILLRARRKAVKLFLSIWWEKAYEVKHGKKPPLPYAVSHLGHQDVIHPEDVIEEEAMRNAELKSEPEFEPEE